jgi:tetratricopeptide (TPR) repeat protein
MKKLTFVFVAVFSLVIISCKQRIDINKEKETILKVIQEEGDAYAANDPARIFAIHVQDLTTIRLQVSANSYHIWNGWDSIKSLYNTNTERNKKMTDVKNIRNIKENVNIKVVGNAAWVMCDNIWKYDYQGKAQESNNIQIAFFEKVNNEWKFSFNAFISKPESNTETQFNTLGYTLLGKGLINDAITIFKVNVDENPLSSNVYDSYAEGLMKDGQNELAIKNYKRSIELDSTNSNAKEQIKIIESRLKPGKK